MPPQVRSWHTPFPSARIWLAQAQVSRSVVRNIILLIPSEVGHTNPVKVWIRMGTFAILAAIIQSNPALGVNEWTASGCSAWKKRISWTNARSSANGAISRCIFMGTQRTCSRWAISSSSSPGELTTTTSYLEDNSRSNPRQKRLMEVGIVEQYINFFIRIVLGLFYGI